MSFKNIHIVALLATSVACAQDAPPRPLLEVAIATARPTLPRSTVDCKVTRATFLYRLPASIHQPPRSVRGQLCLDLEGLPARAIYLDFNNAEVHGQAVADTLAYVALMDRSFPNADIELYNMPPVHPYWTLADHLHANQGLRPILQALDYATPTVYISDPAEPLAGHLAGVECAVQLMGDAELVVVLTSPMYAPHHTILIDRARRMELVRAVYKLGVRKFMIWDSTGLLPGSAIDLRETVNVMRDAVRPLPPAPPPPLKLTGPLNIQTVGLSYSYVNVKVSGPRGIIIDNEAHTAKPTSLTMNSATIEVVDYGISSRACGECVIKDSAITTLGGGDNYCIRGSFDQLTIDNSTLDNATGMNKPTVRLFGVGGGTMTGGEVLGGPVWLGGGSGDSDTPPYLPVHYTFRGVKFVDTNEDFVDFLDIYPGSTVIFDNCTFTIRHRLGTAWPGANATFVKSKVNNQPAVRSMFKNSAPGASMSFQ